MRHDWAYSKYDNLRQRNKADKAMVHELLNIERPTCRERCESCIVVPVMFLKQAIGSMILRVMDVFINNG